MTHNVRLRINLVAVVVLAAVMVTWVVTQLVGPGLVNRPFAVTADFAEGGGVFTNQEVTYRGVLVGKVGELSLNEDGVSIELLIEPRWEHKIPADLEASVNSKSAVGEQYVNLVPRTSGGPFLQDGSEIARADTSLPTEVQALLESLDSVLSDVSPDKTGRVITELSRGLGGRSGEIATILESLGRLADAFASVAPEQQRLLDNATRAGSSFLSSKDAFLRAIRASDRVLAGIGDEPAELSALFSANDRLARAGINLLARRGDELAGGIRALADFVDYQLANKASVVQTLDYLPAFLHAIEDSAVPWESPDGARFYRIRAGVIIDNVKASWPCKYKLPEDYERLPHVRKARKVITDVKCAPAAAPTERAAMRSLVAALQEWAGEHPDAMADLLAGLQPDTSGLPVSGEGFIWPLQGAVTSSFGERWGEAHTGIDIDGAAGDPVVAASSGRVVAAGYFEGYGNTVVIDHGNGLATLYGHLSLPAVRAGDEVGRGELVGAVGCTGSCTGDHLHFEVRLRGVPVDPLPYLPGGALYVGGPGAPPEEGPGEPPPAPGPQPSPSPSPSPRPSPTPSPRPSGTASTPPGATPTP